MTSDDVATVHVRIPLPRRIGEDERLYVSKWRGRRGYGRRAGSNVGTKIETGCVPVSRDHLVVVALLDKDKGIDVGSFWTTKGNHLRQQKCNRSCSSWGWPTGLDEASEGVATRRVWYRPQQHLLDRFEPILFQGEGYILTFQRCQGDRASGTVPVL